MIEPMKNKPRRVRSEQHDIKMARRDAERHRQAVRSTSRNTKYQPN